MVSLSIFLVFSQNIMAQTQVDFQDWRTRMLKDSWGLTNFGLGLRRKLCHQNGMKNSRFLFSHGNQITCLL